MAESPLKQLAEHGQSVWLDFISRDLVTSDELQRLLDDKYVTGMTSNPTIFEKAIEQGSSYDEQLRSLVGAGMTNPDELFLELAVNDIQRAADTLRPIFDRTGGGDGFVSLEVLPSLAHDTAATVAMAKDFWAKVERPNLMIKVPATPAGIPAIEELIAAGMNINVTLIFALSAYEAVAEAYIRGLERRATQGQSLTNRSVASFFVSRVDTDVDPRLDAKLKARPGDAELESLQGKAAIANAVLAYEKFEAIFRGDRFRELREKGAAVQRPLWASTSAKNPKYRDVVYAEALVGPDTVDTMPLATIEAFDDHGIVAGDTVRSDYPGAHEVMRRLAAVGIDMEEVTQGLLDAGVESFAASYNALVRVIAEKADAMAGGLGRSQHLDLGASTKPIVAEAEGAAAAGLVRRIWERDPDVWAPGDAEHAAVIRNRLGWLDVVETMGPQLAGLRTFADEVRNDGVRDVVLLGMGGSSLCPEVLRTSFGSAAGYPTLHVLDTTDPVEVQRVTDLIDPHHVLFIVASKSGGTVETLSHFAHFDACLRTAGIPEPGKAFVAVTDPGTSLAALAKQRNFRRVFENASDIGGRYSALSLFGLVPAALMGLDLPQLMDRAASMLRQCGPGTFATLNVGLVLGTAMGLMHDAGRDKVTILAPPRIAAFGLWAEQLIAESTGKQSRGYIPIGMEPVGEPGVYGDDRLFVALRLGEDAEFDAKIGALRAAEQPVITLEMRDLYDLASEFVRWEFATAVAGAHLGIDPFDEPNVTESKENTKRLLSVFETEGALPPAAPQGGDAAAVVESLLAKSAKGDYVAVMAYVTPSAENQAALQALRTAIRDRQRLATTLGLGPRFLHSTGQLHKGGPNTGVYLQITTDDPIDVAIPGQKYSFSILKRAQAQGDLESLEAHGRRAAHIHIASGLPAALGELATTVRGAVGAAG